jgi:hypothetical protein
MSNGRKGFNRPGAIYLECGKGDEKHYIIDHIKFLIDCSCYFGSQTVIVYGSENRERYVTRGNKNLTSSPKVTLATCPGDIHPKGMEGKRLVALQVGREYMFYPVSDLTDGVELVQPINLNSGYSEMERKFRRDSMFHIKDFR